MSLTGLIWFLLIGLIAMCLTVMLLGPGGWSVDHFLRWRRKDTQQPTQAQQPAAVS